MIQAPPASRPPEPPIRDDYELVPVPEAEVGEGLTDQTTLEPFVFEPAAASGSLSRPTPSSRWATKLPPRALAILAGTATLMTFLATLAVLPARPAALSSLAPHVGRWMHEAWPCVADDPPPAGVAEVVCGSR